MNTLKHFGIKSKLILKDTKSYNKVAGGHTCRMCGKYFMGGEEGTNSAPWICNECNP